MTHFSPKILAFLTVFVLICMSAQAATYYWTGTAGDGLWETGTNWNTAANGTGTAAPDGGPKNGDYARLQGNDNITLTGDVTIRFLFIINGTNEATLNLGSKTLTVTERIRLGWGNNQTGHLIINNGTVTTLEFDTNDNQINSLKLNDTTLTVTGKLLKNGTGTSTISADDPLHPGQFIISSSVTFPNENTDGTIQQGIALVFGDNVTVTSPTTIWTGRNNSVWDNNANWLFGIPADDSDVIISKVTTAPELSTTTAGLKSLTIEREAKFTMAAAGSIKSDKIENRGTFTIKGGSITNAAGTGTPTFVNGQGTVNPNIYASTIIYDGATTPVWANTYLNLQIKSGNLTFSNTDNITINKTFTINSDFTNNAVITAKGDVTSTKNMTGTGNITFAGDAAQTFTTGGKSFSKIGKSGNSDLTITGGGTFTNDVELNTTGTVTLGGTYSTAGLTFGGPVVLNADTSITTSATTDLVWFKNTVTGNPASSLTINTGKTRFDGVVSGLTTLAAGESEIKCSSITSSGTQTYNGDITVSATASLSATEIDFSGDIAAGTNTLKIDAPVFKSTKGTAADVTAGELALLQDSDFQSTTGIVLNATKISGATTATKLTNSGTLTISDGIIVETAIENSGSLTCSNATFANDVILSAGTFSHSSGTVELTAEKKSPATLSGSQTFQNLTISGSVNITGSNTISGLLSATGLTGTIDFSGSTTQHAGSLALSGNSGAGNELNLISTGTWIIEADSNPTTLANLSITNSNNNSGFNFTTTDSTDNGGNTNWTFPGSTYYWRGTSSRDWFVAANWYPGSLPGKGSKIIIQTENATNTNPQLTDDVDISDSNIADNGTILIKDSTCSLDLGNHKLTVNTITNNGTVSLNGSSNDQITATSMVNGSDSTVEYTGSGAATYFVWDGGTSSGCQYENLILNRQNMQIAENLEVDGELTITQAAEITSTGSISAKNTVTASTGLSGDGQLILTGSQANQAFSAGTYTFANVKVDKAGGSLAVSGNCNITNLTITNSPSLVFSGTPEITSIDAQNATGDISFNAGGTIPNGPTFITSGTVSFAGTTQTAALVHNIAGSTTAVTGTLNATSVTLKDAVITGTATINTSGNQIYNGKVYGGGNLVLNSTSGGGSGTITFNDEVNAAAPATVLASLQTTGAVTINTSKIKTSATQTYNDTLSLGSAASVVLEGSAVTFNNPVSDTDAATSLEVNAPLTINSGSSPAGITTSGNQQYDSTVSLGTATVLTAQAGTPAVNQTVTFKGNVTGTTAAGTTLTINANTSIVAADLSITTNGDQTYNGTVTGTGKLTTAGTGTAVFNGNVTLGDLDTQAAKIGTGYITTASGTQVYNGAVELAENTTLTAGTSVSFNANVSGPKSLTVSAPLNINCAQITTSGAAQLYNGTVTLLENTTLSGSTVTFNENVSGSKTLTVSAPLTVNCAQITTSGNTQTYNGTVNLGVNSKFTASQINFNSNITDGAVAGSRKKLTVTSPVFKSTIASGSASIILGELEFAEATTGNTSVQTAGSTTIAFYVPLISGTGKTITLASSGSSFTFDGNVEVNPNLVTSAGTTFTASSGVMTFKADLDLTNGTFAANSGTIVLSAANKGTNQAVLKGDKTYNTLIFTGPVNIQGNNTISTLTANAATLAGKTISFDAGTSQSVTNMTLQGSGTATTQILTLNARGTGNWNISCATEPTLQYLSVSNSTNNSNPAKNFVALNSTDAGGNIEWNFPHMPYKWTGGSDTDWTNTANWQNNVVPTKGANVEIATATHYPLLTAALNLNTSLGTTPYNGIITVDTGATFDLGGQNVTAGQIINNGRVRLTGAAGQTINLTRTNNTNSVVEYYEPSPSATITNFAWGPNYEKLEVNESAEIHTQISVNNTTTITAASSKTITLDSTSNVFTGNVILGTTSTPTGNVTLAATSAENGLIKLANNANAASLTIQTPAIIQSVTTSGVQNYNGDTTISPAAAISSSGDNITFAAGKQLSVNAASSITVPAGKFIYFNGTTTGTAKLTTAGNGTAKFTGNVTNLNSLETQVVDFNCESLSTTGNQTYNGAATISRTGGSTLSSSGGTITFAPTSSITGTTNKLKVETGTGASNAISFAGAIGTSGSPFVELEIGTARTTTFANTVYLGTFTNSDTSGNITFQAGGTISNALTFNTTGNVTLTGTLQAPSLSVTGTFTAAGTANVNTTTTQNYDGNVTINNGSTLNIQNATNVTFAANKTVSGNEFKITTASNTSFNGSVSLNTFTDSTNAGNISFNAGGSIAATSGQTFATTSTVTFGNDSGDDDAFIIGTAGAEKNLTHTAGNTVINGHLTAANITLGNTSGGPMTITNSGLLKTDDTKAISYTTSFTQNGAGNTILQGNFGSTAGSGTASFATSVQLNSSAASTFGTAGDNITITGNLIITAPAAGVTINSQITTQGNIVAYKGPVTVNANISASNDILILGSNYSEQDNSTNISNEYSYTLQRPSGSSSWSSANYNAASLPDGNALPAIADYSATLSAATDTIIYAGKNFYANGTTLSGSGSWNLKLPDLTTPANGFAEAYHSTITDCTVICTDGSSDGSLAKLITLECTDGGSNTNVDFGDFEIVQSYTVRDNAIYVEFNRPVRYHAASVSLLKFNNSTSAPECNFAGPYLYSDPDCTQQLNYDTQLSYFYIKASPQNSASTGAWNTDATGKDPGTTESSDRYGIHHDTMPCLDFPRSLQAQGSTPTIPFILTDRWGKRLTNYSRRVTKAAAAEPAYGSEDSTYDVEDKTGPVLWTVRTGQEIHNAYEAATGETSQHSYDAHNFLEFRYSEPVSFGSSNPSVCDIDIPAYSAGTTPNVVENIQVTDSFGAIQENIAVTTAGTLSFSGLAKIHDVILYTGSQGSANKYVNALYRTDEYSLRLSIAGWTDGTISDYTGNVFKKWAGYIEKASQFTSKTVTAISTSNNLVKDQQGNVQIEYPVSPVQPQIISDSTNLLTPPSPDVYSAWDLSEPIFAPLRLSRETAWGDTEYSEAVGNTNGTGSTLDRIDFHLFDNTPSYTSVDEAEWFTEIGWCLPGSEASKDNLKDTYTYCSDIIGGSRQFDTDAARRTSGGIRMSTKLGIAQAFKYSTDTEATPDQPFDSDLSKLYTTIISSLFTSSSNPRRPINEPDSLYLGIGLTDTSLAIETTFSFSYNEANGYMTDLAGNRLRTTLSRTVDRSVPSFNITLSPVSGKELFIIFVKQIITDSSKLKLTDNSGNAIPIQEDFSTLLPDCFQLISIADDGSYSRATDIQIDTSVPAKIIPAGTNKYFTTFSLTLTKEVTYENLKNRYVQIKQNSNYPELTMDVFTNNINSRVTLIQDKLGNYASMYSAHALSDFAIGLINPLYGYSSDLAYDGDYVMNGLYEKGTWAVHDWNADQQNFGTLPANHPVAIVTTTNDGTTDNSQQPQKARIYYSNSPDFDSIAPQLNNDLNLRLRTWLPSLRDSLFPPFSRKNNDNFGYADSIPVNQNDITAGLLFNIGIDTVKTWNNGDQISFLFGIMNDDGTPARIFNVPYYNVGTNTFDLSLSTAVPLYCLRMHNILDITTLDLWSFKIKSITEQRGGVTILNNVIAPERGEKTVVQVKMPSEGKLNVVVMTLDGNIITYLNRGKTAAGEYYFTWDGRNQNNNIVARGMYFIRVVGSDFDETRKVLVVKD